jgi:hypothetical protein
MFVFWKEWGKEREMKNDQEDVHEKNSANTDDIFLQSFLHACVIV